MSLDMLIELANRINRNDLKQLVIDILRNPRLSISSVEPSISIEESPAAPRKHHMFSGGLVIHTLAVARIAEALVDIFESIYNVKADRDLVLAAAILHDIYKYYQYERDVVGGGYKPREDWYLSHDYAIVAELAKRGARDDIIRVVSEVHGIAPITTIEGLVMHLADSIDAKFGEYIQNVLLSRLKVLEQSGCNTTIALIEAARVEGIKNILARIRSKDELIDIVKKYCRNTRSEQT
ncbi:metal dependent phosphohydrolase [Ignisphaera aggregans DSM 17230]|uniref:Metal dependent phosphohydrolase n=1 Tax=Ignisphaera aggregans (strain DSM 17230 / JCM 13409 / AQ1.S1) TaxID=583356 RepID=E0SSJ6_IGNAA|nr:metal dependent phosphohydrolase [Ignisphaera aggregans DSM 17230]